LTTASALPLLPERTPNQFITAVNLFRPALKYTWEIFDTSLAFLDIKVSIEGCGLAPVCTTKAQILVVICIHLHIHHMSRIPFLMLSFLDFVVFVEMTDFSLKSEEMCDFFDKRGYPASVVQVGHHRAQHLD